LKNQTNKVSIKLPDACGQRRFAKPALLTSDMPCGVMVITPSPGRTMKSWNGKNTYARGTITAS